jgi:hypothetical protein
MREAAPGKVSRSGRFVLPRGLRGRFDRRKKEMEISRT